MEPLGGGAVDIYGAVRTDVSISPPAVFMIPPPVMFTVAGHAVPILLPVPPVPLDLRVEYSEFWPSTLRVDVPEV